MSARWAVAVGAFLVIVACGAAYDEAPAAGGTDAPDSGASADALPGAPTPPRLPEGCPLNECPRSSSFCADETCTDGASRDFDPTGDATTSADDACVVSSTNATLSGFHIETPLEAPRRHAALAFRLLAFDAPDRVIASVTGTGESWSVRSRNGMIELCEINQGGETCAPPIAVELGATVYLYGIASTANPPNASFALSVRESCLPDRVLPATAPFGGTALRGSVGCLGGATACALRVDDVLFAVTSE